MEQTRKMTNQTKMEALGAKNPNVYAALMAGKELFNAENYKGITDETRESVNNLSSAALGTVKQGYDDKAGSEIKYLKMINEQIEKINSSNATDRMKKIRLDKLEKKRIEYENRLGRSQAGSKNIGNKLKAVVKTAQEDDAKVAKYLTEKTDDELKGYVLMRTISKVLPELGLAAANKATRAIGAMKSAGETMGGTINNAEQEADINEKIRAGFKAGAVDLGVSYIPAEKAVSGIGKAASKIVGESAKKVPKDKLSRSLDVIKREGANYGAEYLKERTKNKVQNWIMQSENKNIKKQDDSKENATLNYFGGKLIK